MQKLWAILVYTLLLTCSYIISMEPTLLKPKYPTHDACKQLLIGHLSHNVHKYVNHDYHSSTEASKIIVMVSRINIDLYNTLNNDPTIARDVITNVREYCNPKNEYHIWFLNQFRFPGVQQCYKLSEQLYDNDLTEDKLEELFNKGAIISFNPTPTETEYNKDCPIKYWCTPFERFKAIEEQGTKIIKKLLSLGANPNGTKDGILDPNIHNDNIDIVNIILPYKPRIRWGAWFHAMDRHSKGDEKYIDLLVSQATLDELNAGLGQCIESNFSNPHLMQKFINHGASPSTMLHDLMQSFEKQQNMLLKNVQFTAIFNFLCKNKAFDQNGLTVLYQMQKVIDSLINKLEENQPADIKEIEQ